MNNHYINKKQWGETMAKGIGGWAFLIGLVLAVVIAIFGVDQAWAIYVLAVLGLIVGFLNVTDKEMVKFLVAAIAFMLTNQALGAIVGGLPAGDILTSFFQLVNVFIAPAAAIVAISALYSITKD